MRRRLLVGSAHRYPDLARLAWRAFRRDLLPALSAAYDEVEAVVFCDAGSDGFFPRRFEGARLETPSPGVRDFVEFYDTLLSRDATHVLVLDADVFVLDGAWLAAGAAALERPEVAAVSFLRRTQQPGVYALLLKPEVYARLPRPVFAPSYEGLTVNRQPGDVAAIRLRREGFTIVDADPGPRGTRIADFHGTTVVRMSRRLFEPRIGRRRFVRLVGEKPYFFMGGFDNLLLGSLHHALFGEPFAPGPSGEHLGGSVTAEELREALAGVGSGAVLAHLLSWAESSRRAFDALVEHERIPVPVPRVFPAQAAARARLYRSARSLFRGVTGRR